MPLGAQNRTSGEFYLVPRSPPVRLPPLPSVLMVLFFRFLGHSKKRSKIDLSKKLFFAALFFQTTQNDEKDAQNEGHFGSLLGSFFEFFLGFIFSSIFSQFSTKKIKNEKVKKLIWICKLQCFVRVARLKKTREALENCDEKASIVHELTPNRVNKMGQNKNALKIDENT